MCAVLIQLLRASLSELSGGAERLKNQLDISCMYLGMFKSSSVSLIGETQILVNKGAAFQSHALIPYTRLGEIPSSIAVFVADWSTKQADQMLPITKYRARR